MKALVTGAAGHLGEALSRRLVERGDEVIGLDRRASPHTAHVGDITDKALVAQCVAGADTVFHAATLHKPHIAGHSRQDFIDTNVTCTLTLLEAAAAAGVRAFVFTSTTSVYGDALTPAPGEPAVWVDEDLRPVARNIYGASKLAAEDLCRLIHRDTGMPCVILRASRFFPEEDDEPATRAAYPGDNPKMNEFMFRRADIEDVAEAHLLASEKAPAIGLGTYIVSATTPFARADLADLARDAPAVMRRRVPECEAIYARLGWRMFPAIGRVYDNARARAALRWTPQHDFRSMLARVATGAAPMSDLALSVGFKGYEDPPQA